MVETISKVTTQADQKNNKQAYKYPLYQMFHLLFALVTRWIEYILKGALNDMSHN
jgi:hypothetical protein